MTRNFPLIFLPLVASAATESALAQRTYLATREVLLSSESFQAEPAPTVELHVSIDGRLTWSPAAAERQGPQTILYRAPADGDFAFFFVLRNEAGTSSNPPASGSPAHTEVSIDTVAPLLQVQSAVFEDAEAANGSAGRQVRLRVSLFDENLGESVLRVFFRESAQQPWRDGGLRALRSGELTWVPPATLTGTFDLQLVATDRAGNWSRQPVPAIASKLVRQPPVDLDFAAPSRPSQVPTSGPALIPLVPEAPPSRLARATSTLGASDPNGGRLRSLAQRYLSTGRYDLAAARLTEALAFSPADPGLLAELGDALYWAGRYDEAGPRYREALELQPVFQPALEGLALVAATQQRYPEAREHLERLIELAPDVAEYRLRLGDVRHRLGDAAGALSLWRALSADESATDPLRAKARRRLSYFDPPVERR